MSDIPKDDRFQPFSCPSLKNYQFRVSGFEYPERTCGYDLQGKMVRGEEFLAQRKRGTIVKECPEKTVILGQKGHLLGYVRETFDGTWLAHRCYFSASLDFIEVNGFRNEFYAIRYLHEIMDSVFPDMPYDSLPDLPLRSNRTISKSIKEEIILEALNAAVGYVEEYDREVWLAYGYYQPRSICAVRAIGFVSKFYAARYLYQLAEATFPDLAESVPNLPWE